MSRLAVARTLARVAAGASLDAALAAEGVDQGAHAAHARALIYTTLRHGESARALRLLLLADPSRPLKAPLAALIDAAISELRHLATPAHAAVAAAVDAARALAGARSAGMVNAVLRRFLREREALEARLSREARLEHPRWLIEAIEQAWPAEAAAIFAANNQQAPMWLRVNAARDTRPAALARLAAAGIAADAPPAPPHALRLHQALPVEALPGFVEGLLSVQDVSAQWVVDAVAPARGLRVLDACAAPGGKTAALLEACAGLALIAMDVDAARCAKLRRGLQRLQLEAEIRCADAGDPASFAGDPGFDRILIDAPCTGTGVIRRHPDIKTLRRASDVPALVAQQQRLLDTLWPLLRPGGRLIYATCSILPAENELQMRAFQARHPQAQPIALSPAATAGGRVLELGWQLWPEASAGDGFYWCCWRKPD